MSVSLAVSTSTADGRLHRYWPERNLNLFEHLPLGGTTRSNVLKSNTLIFIGGLCDSFLAVPYVPILAYYIDQCPDWTLMETQLSSSGLGWGTGDIPRDVEEIEKAVEYVREHVTSSNSTVTNHSGKVILMGHSTGCQDVLHYLHHRSEQGRPPVDGAILQAAVSDREGLAMMREQDENVQHAYKECLRISLNSEAQKPQDKICTLPPELTGLLGWPRVHVSSKRFLSLASPSSPVRPELDDLFSSDLSDETLSKTFGAVARSGLLKSNDGGRPSLLILLSAEDEYTPKTVDKQILIERWKKALNVGRTDLAPDSGVIVGASHNVNEQEAQFDLIKRVLGYLRLADAGIPAKLRYKLDHDRGSLASIHCSKE